MLSAVHSSGIVASARSGVIRWPRSFFLVFNNFFFFIKGTDRVRRRLCRDEVKEVGADAEVPFVDRWCGLHWSPPVRRVTGVRAPYPNSRQLVGTGAWQH